VARSHDATDGPAARLTRSGAPGSHPEACYISIMSLSRRQFLAAAGGMCGGIIGTDAFMIEPTKVLVSRHEVLVPGLAPGLDGLRIAQVTDVHFPRNLAAAEATASHLRRERPEIVVLTGDMTERPEGLTMVGAFAEVARGTLATVATLGNWEYYSGAWASAAATYRSVGVNLLVNEHREIEVGGDALVLLGLDDPVLGRPDLPRARTGARADVPEIWLVHAPGIVATWRGRLLQQPALVLSGHTHGGQIRLPLVPPITPSGSGPYVAGWYRDAPAMLYVSRGIGTTAIPARLRCPPELPIFTLRKA
jgi:uncharacterized protein